MNPLQVCVHVADILKDGKAAVVSCEPEDVDFVNPKNFQLVIKGVCKTIKIPLEKDLLTMLGVLTISLFQAD
ncbi:hypothetical protein ABTD73_19355, partial [Acinetobacter baumannii]